MIIVFFSHFLYMDGLVGRIITKAKVQYLRLALQLADYSYNTLVALASLLMTNINKIIINTSS